jgi:uncharacterized protein
LNTNSFINFFAVRSGRAASNDNSMNQKMDLNQINHLAKKLINEKYTMTLATASLHIAWAAPVYYVAYKNHFYFFSSPESRHIHEALGAGQAAAAIYEESTQWQDIKGIQMSGKIIYVSPGLEAKNAFGAYVKKFPLLNSFFSDLSDFNLDGLFSRFQARLYRFTPDSMIYMDNTIRFGFKEEIKLQILGL